MCFLKLPCYPDDGLGLDAGEVRQDLAEVLVV